MDSRESGYVHSLAWNGEALPSLFTFPFRYTPHPLCKRAALIVQKKLQKIGIREGKMFGVLVCKEPSPAASCETSSDASPSLYFLAAYSGQLRRSYNHPWFVPPVVDYLDPESHFQKEQAEIMTLSEQMETLRNCEEVRTTKAALELLQRERQQAIDEAKRIYDESHDDELRSDPDYIHMRQHQKADIQRAKQFHAGEIAQAEGLLADYHLRHRQLYAERKQRSEALQQWLFEQFVFLNGRGESRGLVEIFRRPAPMPLVIPSGAGECCAPKLLQAAYKLGLEPLAMGEFWWGPSTPGHYKEPGAFFPACHSKCRPILRFMLQGLNVEPDPAEHYEQALKPVRVVWEDESLAVIEKPEGWCSIPGKSDQANLFDEALRIWPDIEGSIIVHRLDQDTSGVMVIAKNARVHRALSQQFERREVKKRYVALVKVKNEESGVKSEKDGIPSSGVINLPLGPDLENMPHQRVDHDHGKEAITLYEVLGEETVTIGDGPSPVSSRATTTIATRITFYPQTGRTHQLRVHSASPEGLDAPILGDRLYGQVADRLYLHAEAIDFTHPVTHEPLHFEVPAPF